MKRYEHMTWLEIKEAASETNTAIIPIGAIEMQGPHLPLGVDSMAAQHCGELVAEKANVVLTPLINVGTSEWHKNFPGMIGLSKETLTDYLRQYCRCLVRDGFDHLLFLSPHVVNDDPISTVALELRDEGILVGQVNLWHITSEIAKNKKIGFKENKFTHAGEIMTSVMMAIAPETVKMDKAVAESASPPIEGCPTTGLHKINFQDVSFFIYRSSNEETTSGSLGDPMAANAENGRQIIDGWVEVITAFIEHFSKC